MFEKNLVVLFLDIARSLLDPFASLQARIACGGRFDWVEDSVLFEQKRGAGGLSVEIVFLKKKRPFCGLLGVLSGVDLSLRSHGEGVPVNRIDCVGLH